MAPTTTGRTTQVTIRLGHDVLARLDAVAAKMTRPGLVVGRTDVLRMAIVAGLPQIERTAGAQRTRRKAR
jgi:predicted transcriptional regulator